MAINQEQKTQPSITRAQFGVTTSGEEISSYTLKNNKGTEAVVINFGAILQSLKTADKSGQLADIVLGYDSLAEYQKNPHYLGATIGRFGNRIANGRCAIDGKEYTFAVNNGPNHLHGGLEGFDKKVWSAEGVLNESSAGVILKLTSPDGDQGYPGTLDVTVEYKLTNDDELIISYHATTDKTTIINLTNHSYFNLKGEGDILAHQLYIPSTQMTPVNSAQIPTGEICSVLDTPFDFTNAKEIGRDIDADNEQIHYGSGYDHNYVLNKSADELTLAAEAYEPSSGRVLTISTTEPGFQLYTGNFLDGFEAKNRIAGKNAAFCIEPQHVPDAPNQSVFKSTELKPGDLYRSEMRLKFSVK
ncbi:aldose epimerase family protein [Catenovulum sediminis]|uniref:Aldose 1-epimerase n=1 Tax=Catenovulum sediminis TaxID=1740262 RepID=A0ABV1RIY5_9ALTE